MAPARALKNSGAGRWRLVKRVYHGADEIGAALRWLLLRFLGALLRRTNPNSRLTERRIIKIGNLLFPAAYPAALFRDYNTYVTGYPASLQPYLDLCDPKRWLEGRSVLDLGSGLGQYSELLVRAGARQVVAMEYQPGKARWSAARLERAGLRCVGHLIGAAQALPLASGSFDTIFSHTVFEHLADVAGALSEAGRVLKPGGYLLVGFNFVHHRGGHHLFPYIHFPWAPWGADEQALCEYWSERLAADQERGLMGFFPRGCAIRSLSEGEETYLNRMDFETFEKLAISAGFRIFARRASEALAALVPLLPQRSELRKFLLGTIFYLLESGAGAS